MLIFQFKDTNAALRYWQVICELGIDDLKGREEILVDFAKYGEMARVQHTNRTREEIVRDWSKEYNVMDVKDRRDENGKQRLD